MREGELALLARIVNGLCSVSLYIDRDGTKACHFCYGRTKGYYDSSSFEHEASCPVTLNEQLQTILREKKWEQEKGEEV